MPRFCGGCAVVRVARHVRWRNFEHHKKKKNVLLLQHFFNSFLLTHTHARTHTYARAHTYIHIYTQLSAAGQAFVAAARGAIDFVQIVHVVYYELAFNAMFAQQWVVADQVCLYYYQEFGFYCCELRTSQTI